MLWGVQPLTTSPPFKQAPHLDDEGLCMSGVKSAYTEASIQASTFHKQATIS